MINNKMAEMLNKQINLELFSGYLYLEMANYYEDEGLNGFANWFTVQAQEEQDHAMLIRTYLLNNEEKIHMDGIGNPTTKFKDFKEPLTMALSHEQEITNSINGIYSEATEAKDYRTMKFLDWFIEEQGEEEKNVNDLISKYELFSGDSRGLYLLNEELGQRVHVAPTLTLD